MNHQSTVIFPIFYCTKIFFSIGRGGRLRIPLAHFDR
jgi:hypothetical protein